MCRDPVRFLLILLQHNELTQVPFRRSAYDFDQGTFSSGV